MMKSNRIWQAVGILALLLAVPTAMADGASGGESAIQAAANGNLGAGGVDIDLNKQPLDTLGYYEISGMSAAQQSDYFSRLDAIINAHPPKQGESGLHVLNSMAPISIGLDEYKNDMNDVYAWAKFRRKIFLACKSPALLQENQATCDRLRAAMDAVRKPYSAAPPTEADEGSAKDQTKDAARSTNVVMPMARPAWLDAGASASGLN